MILQNLIGKIYSVFIEIFLWVLPIASSILAVVFLKEFHWAFTGFIVGLIMDVILIGPVIILLNIRSSLQNIEAK